LLEGQRIEQTHGPTGQRVDGLTDDLLRFLILHVAPDEWVVFPDRQTIRRIRPVFRRMVHVIAFAALESDRLALTAFFGHRPVSFSRRGKYHTRRTSGCQQGSDTRQRPATGNQQQGPCNGRFQVSGCRSPVACCCPRFVDH